MLTLKEQKAALRKERLALRDAIPAEDRIEKSLAISAFGEALSFAPGTIVSGFLPIRSEADIRPLLDHLAKRGARLCLPIVADREAGNRTGGHGFRHPGPGAGGGGA